MKPRITDNVGYLVLGKFTFQVRCLVQLALSQLGSVAPSFLFSVSKAKPEKAVIRIHKAASIVLYFVHVEGAILISDGQQDPQGYACKCHIPHQATQSFNQGALARPVVQYSHCSRG